MGKASRRGIGGRPKLPPSVIVRIGKAEFELAYKVSGFPISAPFREVFLSLLLRRRWTKIAWETLSEFLRKNRLSVHTTADGFTHIVHEARSRR
jgi:hypothetical protein